MLAIMFQLCFFWFCFTISSSLRTLNQHINCAQLGLDNCRIGNCSEPKKVNKTKAPTAPSWGPEHLDVVLDREQFTPVLKVSWTIQATVAFLHLQGSQIIVRDESTNEAMCLEYSYKLVRAMNPNYQRWRFTLEDLVVQPEHTYEVSVYNLPEPKIGVNSIMKKIVIPGCANKTIEKSQKCRENGSLWNPSTNASFDWIEKQLSIRFYTSEYSEKYNVLLKSPGVFSSVTKVVLKENQTLLNVTFELTPLQCEFEIKIQPFFKSCTNHCWPAEKPFDFCSYYPPRTLLVKIAIAGMLACTCLAYLLLRTCATYFHPISQAQESTSQSADNDAPQCTPMAKRKRLLIIYSMDHPLYKNIVLKLCSFLMAKCGTEVVLDMLDSTRLGMIGGLQWLEWHKQQIEKSSDKILILCSRGVQAKWSAMCTGKQVQLKEDVRSAVGDMLVPAFCLMVPELVKSASFEKYIVAYFDGVSTEDDVPAPFNITVRYKLMKQFEELFFRILGSEKHEVGRVNRIEGLSEDEYHLCPTGRALRKAIEDFHAHQIEHPHWFEEELIEDVEMDIDSDVVSVYQDDSGQIVTDFASEATTILLSEQRVQLSLKCI